MYRRKQMADMMTGFHKRCSQSPEAAEYVDFYNPDFPHCAVLLIASITRVQTASACDRHVPGAREIDVGESTTQAPA